MNEIIQIVKKIENGLATMKAEAINLQNIIQIEYQTENLYISTRIDNYNKIQNTKIEKKHEYGIYMMKIENLHLNKTIGCKTVYQNMLFEPELR